MLAWIFSCWRSYIAVERDAIQEATEIVTVTLLLPLNSYRGTPVRIFYDGQELAQLPQHTHADPILQGYLKLCSTYTLSDSLFAFTKIRETIFYTDMQLIDLGRVYSNTFG